MLALGAIFPEADPAFLYQLDKSFGSTIIVESAIPSNTSTTHLKYLLFILTAKDVSAFASNNDKHLKYWYVIKFCGLFSTASGALVVGGVRDICSMDIPGDRFECSME